MAKVEGGGGTKLPPPAADPNPNGGGCCDPREGKFCPVPFWGGRRIHPRPRRAVWRRPHGSSLQGVIIRCEHDGVRICRQGARRTVATCKRLTLAGSKLSKICRLVAKIWAVEWSSSSSFSFLWLLIGCVDCLRAKPLQVRRNYDVAGKSSYPGT
jgi:hypothetical protein